MMGLGPLGFTAPWLLLGLLALPVLWLILRAVPPAPVRRMFPGVVLLLGLQDDDSQTDRTPWWLLLLRMLAVAAIILGLAGPVLNPDRDRSGSGPLLIVMDAGWAGATGWQTRLDALDAQLADAARAGRAVALLQLSDPEAPVFQGADALRSRLAGLAPRAWAPGPDQIALATAALSKLQGGFDSHWFTDTLDYDGRAGLLDLLD
ncbi:MAG: BatA domain-containing protein, partial [Marinibacterium sp.]|nr:BatA domain-containing protein [Marinibacterium sp.]